MKNTVFTYSVLVGKCLCSCFISFGKLHVAFGFGADAVLALGSRREAAKLERKMS
jgi:hypothetical protein